MAKDGILAQVAPTTTAADTLLYQAQAGARIAVFVCNRNAAPQTFRLRLVTKGNSAPATPESRQFVFYDTNVNNGATLEVANTIRLAEGDAIWVRPSSVDMTFTVIGVEA